MVLYPWHSPVPFPNQFDHWCFLVRRVCSAGYRRATITQSCFIASLRHRKKLFAKQSDRSLIPLKGGPSRVEQNFDMTAIYQWQFDHHKGHVHSFQNTVRYGPLKHRENLWSKVCDILAGRTRPDSPLHGSKLLALFGRDDDIVIRQETTEDILKLLPPDHLQVEYLPGGHGFPYPNSEKITQTILSFWNSKSSPVLRKNSSNLCSPWECDSIRFCLLGNDRRPEDFVNVQLRIILINRCKCGV